MDKEMEQGKEGIKERERGVEGGERRSELEDMGKDNKY